MKRLTQKSLAALLTVWMLVGCASTGDKGSLAKPVLTVEEREQLRPDRIFKAQRSIAGIVLGTNVLVAAIMIIDPDLDVSGEHSQVNRLVALAFNTIESIKALAAGMGTEVETYADNAIALFEADMAARTAELGGG